MEKEKRKFIIISLMIIILIIIIAVRLNYNTSLKCKTVDRIITINFKGNKPIYVKGKIFFDDSKMTVEQIKQLESMYNGTSYDSKKNAMNINTKYSEENKRTLDFLGFYYDKKYNYKKTKSDLESNDYYCE